MIEMCHRLKIKLTELYAKAAVFDQGAELGSEVARLQLKTLDEKEIWFSGSEADAWLTYSPKAK